MRIVSNIAPNREPLPRALQHAIGKTSCTQIVLRNTTDQPQEFRLWGANLGYGGGGYPSVPAGVFPLRMVHNPVNNLLYAINQQEGSVTVFSGDWQVVTTIELEAANPGEVSPASITVNPETGDVYVVGSMSDKLYTIATDFTVATPLNLLPRPISVVWNPVTAKIYVASLAADRLEVIDPATLTVEETIAVGNAPVQVGVSETGNLLVLHQQDESLQVIRPDHTPLATISNLTGLPVAFAVLNNAAFVVTKAPGTIYKAGLESFSIEATAALPAPTSAVLTQSSNEQLVISLPTENKLCVVDEDLVAVETTSLPGGVSGLGFHPDLEVVMVADHLHQRILILSGNGNGSAVVVSDNYTRVNNDFQFNPALVKHLRVICSGADYYPAITVTSRTPSGRSQHHSVSLAAHRSPWQWQNVAEVLGMDGEIISGKTWWLIRLLPDQTITLLIYYRQFRRDRHIKSLAA